MIALTLLSASAFYVAANPVETGRASSSVIKSLGRYLLSGTFRVQAQRVTWHRVPMRANTDVYVSLSGDGTTDLDMYILDANYKSIDSSTRNGDDEAVDLEIYQNGYFWVKVVNYGSVYNDYTVTAIQY
jgi:hypothetical protein